MSGINQNIPSLVAQRMLRDQNRTLSQSLQRLSTGIRINRGADNPALLIASENLRAEKTAISSAISNSQRAEQVVNVAEGGLQEISNMLVELQGLVGSTANEAGVSQEERDANQLQIDSILQTIDRIANSTSFQGTKLLNGNFDYRIDGKDDGLSQVTVNAAKLSESGAPREVTVGVIEAAEQGAVYLSTGPSFSAGGSAQVSFEITGTRGVQQFTFAEGTTQSEIVDAINSFEDALGVTARVSLENDLRIEIRSTGFGSSSFIRMKELTTVGPAKQMIFAAASGGTGMSDLRDAGENAVVVINGMRAVSNGLTARVSSDGFDVSITIDGNSSLNAQGGTANFSITGGGANFNLSPSVSLAGKVSLGIETVTTGNLGGIAGFLSDLKSGGDANLQNGSLTKAQEIVDSAIKQVSSLRGRLGAFQKNVVGTTISSLGIALENTTAAESAIRDTDFAAETAAMTRAQILSQAATQSLALANSAPQQVLALIR